MSPLRVESGPDCGRSLPVTNIAPFLEGNTAGKRDVAEAVARQCRATGFLIIEGHGLSEALLDRAFKSAFRFFDQPDAAKNRWHPAGAAKQRGYHGIATRGLASTLDKDAPKDLRESLFLGPIEDHREAFSHLVAAANVYAPNILPTEPDGFDTALVELYRGFERLAADLMRIFAVALDMPEQHFATMIDKHFSIMSVHHYPALTKPPEPGQLRTGAHTDYGSLTILAMTEANGGLEAQLADGTWLPVVARPGQLIVNLGDMMQRWTNDRWVSTIHRVVTPAKLADAASRRLSIGYFMHPNYDANISCFPSCLEDGAVPRYPVITAGDHIRLKIEKSHIGAAAKG